VCAVQPKSNRRSLEAASSSKGAVNEASGAAGNAQLQGTPSSSIVGGLIHARSSSSLHATPNPGRHSNHSSSVQMTPGGTNVRTSRSSGGGRGSGGSRNVPEGVNMLATWLVQVNYYECVFGAAGGGMFGLHSGTCKPSADSCLVCIHCACRVPLLLYLPAQSSVARLAGMSYIHLLEFCVSITLNTCWQAATQRLGASNCSTGCATQAHWAQQRASAHRACATHALTLLVAFNHLGDTVSTHGVQQAVSNVCRACACRSTVT
jgi:hypothetical protein